MSVVSVSAYLAYRFDGQGDWVNAALALVMMMLFQAGSSTLSDCSDHLRGVDGPEDLKVTWIYSGLFPIATLRRYAAALLGLGALAGGLMLLRGAMDAVWLGLAGVALGLGYSFLKYRALGDVAILLAFALLPAVGVGRVVAGSYLPETLLVVLPVGLITLSIVHANNWRDIVTDRAAGIRTLPILAGAKASAVIYAAEVLLPYALLGAYVTFELLPASVFAVLLTLPLAVRNLSRPLATLDRDSALLQLAFGTLYSLSLVFSALTSTR